MNRLDLVEQIITCTRCELAAQCNGPVPWRGDPARIVIVGEAPGQTEDEVGKPFVGPAGKLLDSLLDEASIDTDDVAIMNTVCCYPHDTPTHQHIRACHPNFTAQLAYLSPRYVLLLGRVALAAVRPDVPLRRGRGRPFQIGERIYFATYHPAAALRNSAYEGCMRNDLETFRELLDAPDWTGFVPSSCTACPLDAQWWEATGLGWCPVHLPSEERDAYEARLAANAAEADRARRDAVAARDAGMAAVANAADPDWMTAAWDALIDWLRHHDRFFVDDFWAGTGLAQPREARALGPIVMRAAREGLMEKTGEFRKSVRSNMTEKPVWASLIRQT